MIKYWRQIIRQNLLMIILLVVLGVSLVIAYWWSNRDYRGPTGGVGQPDKNTVRITGWDELTDTEVELGLVVSVRQQTQITEQLSQLIQQYSGRFDYLDVVVQKPIQSRYDKATKLDQTIFAVRTKDGQIFNVIVDHATDEAQVVARSK